MPSLPPSRSVTANRCAGRPSRAASALPGPGLALLAALVLAAGAGAQSFVNWESPHVHPLDITPEGSRLVAVNTPDARLEVFDATGEALLPVGSVAVGLDPVSVRVRGSTEAWVVNHVSDSVSVVDLATLRVRATLITDDEPCDVVFAGDPLRAFVSCSQPSSVLVYDPDDLAIPPVRLALDVEEPRAMAVSADGTRVFVASFESGNRSTVLGGSWLELGGVPPDVVSFTGGPYEGANPPPNGAGGSFVPPLAPGLPPPPRTSLIVKQGADGAWRDDTGADWTPYVSGSQALLSGRVEGWDLPDRDVAVIETDGLAVSWVTGLMNLNMALAVDPISDRLAVVGTEALNEVRFEPNLNGTFLRVLLALVEPGSEQTLVDLNPHLDYATPTAPPALRERSLGDPRAVVFEADGSRLYVAGMGSDGVVVVDAAGAPLGDGPIPVGQGPTGLARDPFRSRLYVLNRFGSSVSVIDVETLAETERRAFHDASPAAITAGRRHLYDTHATSGLGHLSCASCHVDARTDRVAWDLGDPAGAMVPVVGNLAAGDPELASAFTDHHPMKGPMLTQTLQDIIGKEPFHWRGDKAGLEDFNGAFVNLQGAEALLSTTEMQEFEDFLATIHLPPNPYRALDNGLDQSINLDGFYTTGAFGPAGLPLPVGDAARGLDLFLGQIYPNNPDSCSECHALPAGMGTDSLLDRGLFTPFPVGPLGEHHHMLLPLTTGGTGPVNVSMKVPGLRNLHERTGHDRMRTGNRAGFGYLHDGTADTLERIASDTGGMTRNDQDAADLVAFLLSLAGGDLPSGSPDDPDHPPGTPGLDTHAAVGRTLTLDAFALSPFDAQVLGALVALADAGPIDLVAHALGGGAERGWAYQGGGLWLADRAGQSVLTAGLLASAAVGQELTVTAVPAGSATRLGIDRDQDGSLDGDERDAASDPADPTSVPGACTTAPPEAPLGLEVVVLGGSQARLTWDDPVAGAAVERWRVVRIEAGGGLPAVLVADLPAEARHLTDVGLECGSSYTWRVLARNCAGPSSASSVEADTVGCLGEWQDLGGALTGSVGTPGLSASAPPLPGTAVTLQLESALPGAVAYMVLGIAVGDTPFKQGTLVPTPDLVDARVVAPDGTQSWPVAFPVVVPPGFVLVGQVWVADAVGPAGWSATNGLAGYVP